MAAKPKGEAPAKSSVEATVVILDNSEWARNGDYTPSRMEAQVDAANIICGAKTGKHNDNTCAIVTMGGTSGVRVLLSLTNDAGKMLNATHGIEVSGTSDLVSALKTAVLVLRHRMPKEQNQRIVAFVGSPLKQTTEELIVVAKQLRMSNVSVDIVNFGELEANTEKLEKFIENVNKEGTAASHLVPIPPGPHILSDLLAISPIIHPEGVVPGEAPSMAVDANNDPEFAEALRESLLDYQRDMERAAPASQKPAAPPPPVPQDSEDDDEELRQAMLLSRADFNASTQQNPALTQAPPTTSVPPPEDMNDDEILAMKLSLGEDVSLFSQEPTQTQPNQQPNQGNQTGLELPQDVNSLLASLPGVDPSDPQIQEVIASLQKQQQNDTAPQDKKDQNKKDSDMPDGQDHS
ncbi:26S proteasome non-ATPase regulatory subunit 4 [Pelomyxa schiedti]|nr:26S proteasome non-ATPase regulatory subunit 4 [Pelomyxa schiedti]